MLGVRGPFGEPLAGRAGSRARTSSIAAGGIGLAPLRPALLRLLARRERYGRLVLLYGGARPSSCCTPTSSPPGRERGLEVLVTVDSAGPEWLGHVGVVTRLIRRAGLDPSGDTLALSCGPEVMMRFTVAGTASTAGSPPTRSTCSMERNMQCGIGHCGHCQLGPTLVCRDGPVYRWSEIEPWLAIREL